MTHPAAVPTALYRLRDSDGQLLYVGITSTPASRMGAHRREKPWWSEVDPARTTYDWLPDRPTAERAEVATIAQESPRYNVADNPAERAAMVARAREVSRARLASYAGDLPAEWEAAADAIEAVEDPAERARLAGQQLADAPVQQKALRAVRGSAVREMQAGGLSNAEIARRLGVHRNRVPQLLT
ncbi:GIY-YIG nuclease family protein [Micromonospora sp. WMMD980]|uniref:GIY-YIG nuclease family protein n=1 Tax=Micromonospora sp. WMMD980 TaxID=3016088 RepID=UPI00241597EE|nr:GIY-YIG nuclease family protein [Micromonospora sp. WMMD980]MDG4798995.1 GIY-YIG nuclease family protein [Micromonospora sp. WMMD980]MDG4799001.1 GIY-YIG nuclease family protein [Micromonospora sp. WMMD980]MDG4799067.1 GIY-YIG nuclease family protein [Micromonospora sp. WMMD980]